MIEITKTIRCKLIGLTKRKLELLNREYDNFQHYLKTGVDKGVYSATKQQGKRTYRKIEGFTVEAPSDRAGRRSPKHLYAHQEYNHAQSMLGFSSPAVEGTDR